MCTVQKLNKCVDLLKSDLKFIQCKYQHSLFRGQLSVRNHSCINRNMVCTLNCEEQNHFSHVRSCQKYEGEMEIWLNGKFYLQLIPFYNLRFYVHWNAEQVAICFVTLYCQNESSDSVLIFLANERLYSTSQPSTLNIHSFLGK